MPSSLVAPMFGYALPVEGPLMNCFCVPRTENKNEKTKSSNCEISSGSFSRLLILCRWTSLLISTLAKQYESSLNWFRKLLCSRSATSTSTTKSHNIDTEQASITFNFVTRISGARQTVWINTKRKKNERKKCAHKSLESKALRWQRHNICSHCSLHFHCTRGTYSFHNFDRARPSDLCLLSAHTVITLFGTYYWSGCCCFLFL